MSSDACLLYTCNAPISKQAGKPRALQKLGVTSGGRSGEPTTLSFELVGATNTHIFAYGGSRNKGVKSLMLVVAPKDVVQLLIKAARIRA